MTTTLRMFYARAIPVLMFLAVLIVLLMLSAGFAFSQEAGPVTVDQIAAPVAQEGYTGIAGLADSLLTGFAASVAGVIALVLARLWNLIPEAVRAVIKHIQANTSLKDTTDTAAWHKSLQELSEDGLLLAAAKIGLDPKSIQSWEEKNAFLKLAGAFVEKFDSDIKLLIDKDGDGVPDVVQVALARYAPHTVSITPPTQAFMPEHVEPQPRGVKPRDAHKEIQAFAAKYAPKRAKAGTVQ